MALFGVIFLTAVFGFLLWWWLRDKYNYWSKKGVHTHPPFVPFGNVKDSLMLREQIGVDFANSYWATRDSPFVGIYMLHRPTLLVNDLELAKNVLSKDFAHFVDHSLPFDESVEPLQGHLFNLTGAKWKNLRVKLTPTFTSSKMKMMFNVLAKCAQELDQYAERVDVEDAKDMMARFGNDVIASCAFGIECNSFKNPDDAFRAMGKRSITPTLWESFKSFLDFFVPNITRKIGMRVFAEDLEQFYMNIVKQTVGEREKSGIVRNDFLQLLIDLKNKGEVDEENAKEKHETLPDDGTRLTMSQLAAQVFVFFIAGFETSSTTASFALYEMALNPDVQKTVAEEIREVKENHQGKITYESLLEMTYLNKIIQETLRKYPPVPVIFRVCTKDYIIPGSDVLVEKDTPVMIPIYGIQRDPQYFPNPDKFDPERFSQENIDERHHYSYLPFGEGPRICIGNRFGLMQTRLGLATILSKYEVLPCEKTLIPMRYDCKSFILSCDGGIWLKFKKRVN